MAATLRPNMRGGSELIGSLHTATDLAQSMGAGDARIAPSSALPDVVLKMSCQQTLPIGCRHSSIASSQYAPHTGMNTGRPDSETPAK